MTPDEAKDLKKVSEHSSTDCETKKMKIGGNKVSFSLTCHKHGGVQLGSGEFVYQKASYEGTLHLEIDNPRIGKRKITTHISGKRIGDCT